MTGTDGLDPLDAELMAVARRAAERAADVHRARSPEGREWAEKGRADFVTDVDLEAQEVVLEAIAEAFPDHRIVAEEEDEESREERDEGSGAGTDRGPGDEGADADAMRWIVDPLDGTTNWLHGYPEYAVSIAVEDGEGLRAAVVLNSASGERYEAVRGAGATRDGGPIEVSRVADLEMALVGTGFPFKKPEYMDEYLQVFRSLLFRTSGVRRAGSAALDLCALACGRLDAFWEHWLMPWDVAGGALVLREAGGHLEEFPLPGREDAAARDRSGRPLDGVIPARSFASRRGGAYLGSNGLLREPFREAVLRAGIPA